MTGIEALQDLRYDVSMSQDINYKIANEECDIIEKELKALEIIKNHKLLNYVIKNKKCANMYHLDDEEINFLKEVLNNE